ncbi:MAG: methylated-DNA--[protein]-cysteine S-methyltransferase [Pelagibacterales bacterium]|jgi:methylated-DNA-[protein]-cysteine S-methyltransferase|nr:methylated-DNA--[protein]-cysteine S-methyltransferase [Pelagibacterales bacterium]
MKKNKQLIFKSKFGNIRITSEEEKIIHIEFTNNNLINSNSNILNITKNQIEEYLLNNRKKFSIDISLNGTDFQHRVWEQIKLIPYGKHTTYLKIAKILKTSPRAVGNACGKNPILLIIPCHRVIASNGNLTGFSALGGINTKKHLLDHEKL